MTVRRSGMRAIGATVDGLTKPLFEERGFRDAALLNQWETIAGHVLAEHTSPGKISYPGGQRRDGTLHLTVSSSALAIELQHLEPQLLERVNTYFGYKAVARLRIVQGPLPQRRDNTSKPAPPLSTEKEAELTERVAKVADEELRTALRNLGVAIAADDKS